MFSRKMKIMMYLLPKVFNTGAVPEYVVMVCTLMTTFSPADRDDSVFQTKVTLVEDHSVDTLHNV